MTDPASSPFSLILPLPSPTLAITHLGDPGSYGLSAERWRLIHYANGDEELYDIGTDPYEWTNLAAKPESREQLVSLRSLAPTTFAPAKSTGTFSEKSITLSKWPASDPPASRPEGTPFRIQIDNQSESIVRLYWLAPDGSRQNPIEIQPASQRPIRTRNGAAWLVTDLKDTPLGYFPIKNHPGKAIIPDL